MEKFNLIKRLLFLQALVKLSTAEVEITLMIKEDTIKVHAGNVKLTFKDSDRDKWSEDLEKLEDEIEKILND